VRAIRRVDEVAGGRIGFGKDPGARRRRLVDRALSACVPTSEGGLRRNRQQGVRALSYEVDADDPGEWSRPWLSWITKPIGGSKIHSILAGV
jgi:hypothetical protein